MHKHTRYINTLAAKPTFQCGSDQYCVYSFPCDELQPLIVLPSQELQQLVGSEEDVDEEEEQDDLEDEDGNIILGRMKALRGLPAHMVEALEAAQAEAVAANKQLRPAALKAAAATRKLHRKLKIIAGSAAGVMQWVLEFMCGCEVGRGWASSCVRVC